MVGVRPDAEEANGKNTQQYYYTKYDIQIEAQEHKANYILKLSYYEIYVGHMPRLLAAVNV